MYNSDATLKIWEVKNIQNLAWFMTTLGLSVNISGMDRDIDKR